MSEERCQQDCGSQGLRDVMVHCLTGSRRHAEEESYCVASRLSFSEEGARNFSQAVAGRIGRESPPLAMLELFLTDHCNLACSYCFVEGKDLQGPMSLEAAKDAFTFFLEQSGSIKDLNLLLMGGEPLLRFGMLTSFLPWAKAAVKAAGKGLRVDMTSNGTLLDDEKAAFLKRMGVMVLLSVDGDRESHDRYRVDRSGAGSFSAVLDGMQALRRNQGYVGVKMTVSADEVSNLFDNVRTLTEIGVQHFIVGHATGREWSLDQMKELCAAYLRVFGWWNMLPGEGRPTIGFIENALRKKAGSPRPSRHSYGCRAGRHGIMVAPDGGLYPCSKAYGVEAMRDFFRLGSVKDGFSNDLLRGQLSGRIAVKRRACWDCALQRKCYGGCIAVNAAMTGNAFDPSPNECRFQALQNQVTATIRQQARADGTGKGE